MRIQLDLADENIAQLEKLKAKAGVRTYKELLDNALALLSWCSGNAAPASQLPRSSCSGESSPGGLAGGLVRLGRSGNRTGFKLENGRSYHSIE